MQARTRWWCAALSIVAVCGSARADILYGLTSQGIVRIDTNGPRVLEVFPVQESLTGLSLDATTGTWYSVRSGTRFLRRVEPVPGKVLQFATAEPPGLKPYRLASDPTSDVLSVAQSSGAGVFLVCYSKTSGDYLSYSWTIAQWLADLSYDKFGKLWGVDNIYRSLCYFDPKTGNMQLVNQGGLQPYGYIRAFAVSLQGRFWAIHNPFGVPELLEIDPIHGTATSAGSITGFPPVPPITALTAAPRWKQVYCTSKPALVCGPSSISATGIPTASGIGGPFTVRGGPVLGQKVAFLRYSISGRSAVPWDGGYLCVSTCPPLLAVPVVASGQPGQCNGLVEIDMNAFGQGLLGGNPSPVLRTPHSIICVQWWGRDTVATGTMMTDALQYVLWP